MQPIPPMSSTRRLRQRGSTSWVAVFSPSPHQRTPSLPSIQSSDADLSAATLLNFARRAASIRKVKARTLGTDAHRSSRLSRADMATVIPLRGLRLGCPRVEIVISKGLTVDPGVLPHLMPLPSPSPTEVLLRAILTTEKGPSILPRLAEPGRSTGPAALARRQLRAGDLSSGFSGRTQNPGFSQERQ